MANKDYVMLCYDYGDALSPFCTEVRQHAFLLLFTEVFNAITHN